MLFRQILMDDGMPCFFYRPTVSSPVVISYEQRTGMLKTNAIWES